MRKLCALIWVGLCCFFVVSHFSPLCFGSFQLAEQAKACTAGQQVNTRGSGKKKLGEYMVQGEQQQQLIIKSAQPVLSKLQS